MRITMLVGVLILVGCGSGLRTEQAVDAELKPYLETFIQVAKDHGRDTAGWEYLPMKFDGNLSDNKEGECVWFMGRHVNIDPTYFHGVSEAAREALIFHELGHCLLEQHEHRNEARNVQHEIENDPRHWSEGYQAGCSIMWKSVTSRREWEAFRSEYIEELFAGGGPCVIPDDWGKPKL